MRSKTAFDKDLEEYLAHRNRRQFIHDIVQTFKSSKPTIKLNPEIKTYEDDLEVRETPRKSFFEKLFSKKEKTVELQELRPSKEELKFVAQVALNHIKKLPPEEIELFKVSAEFEKLKQVLKKYNLIK